jgi:hypothetical protein
MTVAPAITISRTVATMGGAGGFPDLMFFGIDGEVCCVELKAEGGRLSES